MKIIEITSGIILPITNEESLLLKKFQADDVLMRATLTDREQRIADDLVIKDVLLRKNMGGKIGFRKK